MRILRSSSGQSSPSGTESSTIRYGREEKELSLSWMRSLRSSSGQSSPSGTESSTIRYERVHDGRVVCATLLARVLHWEGEFQYQVRQRRREQSPLWMRSLRSSSGQSSPLGIDISTTRCGREKREQGAPLLVRVLHREQIVPLPRMRRGESAMDEKLHSSSGSEFSIGNEEFKYQVQKSREEQSLSGMRSLNSSSGPSSPLGTRTFPLPGMEEKKVRVRTESVMRSFHSSSGQSSPLGTDSSSSRYGREYFRFLQVGYSIFFLPIGKEDNFDCYLRAGVCAVPASGGHSTREPGAARLGHHTLGQCFRRQDSSSSRDLLH